MNPVILALLIAVPVSMVIGALYGWRMHYNRVKSDLRLARDERLMTLSRSGCTMMLPGVTNYHVMSFDGGHTWYAVKDTTLEVVPDKEFGGHRRNFTLEIVGPADEVYPGLMAHIRGMDALVKHAREHGPITLGSPHNVELLEGAGFTVTRTPAE